MESIIITDRKSNIDLINKIITESEKNKIQPINVVDVSELKIDVSGSTGKLIDENVDSFFKDLNIENKNMNLESVEKGINDFLKSAKTEIKIEIHRETNKPIFKIVRSEDHVVIKEIPPKEVLDLIKRISDMVGSLCDCAA